jgi:predicted porin
MNKKLMVVAVAGALAAPAVAFAQASNVEIYGRANLGVDNYSATGATAANSDWKSRTRVFDNGSRLGVRGTEDLGGGLKAVFLMENGVAMDRGDGNGQSGTANGSVGLAARVGYVGLAGGWGQLTFGKQNVFWTNGQHEQWQANYGTVGNQFMTGGFGRGMGVGVSRQQNTVQYASPVMNGVNAIVSYSPSAAETAAANANADGKVWGLTVQGTHPNGIIWAWDYASNAANSPAVGPQAKGVGNKLRGGWLYAPGANISLFYIRMNQSNAGVIDATSSSMRQQGWGIVWEHTWGNLAAEANWSKVGNATGCNVAASCQDTNWTAAFVGLRYNLSKRTSVMTSYTKYSNAANSNADVTAGGMSSISGAVPNGVDPRIIAVGVQHNF